MEKREPVARQRRNDSFDAIIVLSEFARFGQQRRNRF